MTLYVKLAVSYLLCICKNMVTKQKSLTAKHPCFRISSAVRLSANISYLRTLVRDPLLCVPQSLRVYLYRSF